MNDLNSVRGSQSSPGLHVSRETVGSRSSSDPQNSYDSSSLQGVHALSGKLDLGSNHHFGGNRHSGDNRNSGGSSNDASNRHSDVTSKSNSHGSADTIRTSSDNATSSIGRNSLTMAVGTAASRVTGQIRTILLAAALGTTGLAANSYQASSTIPQVIYTLVSGGIFNAVLVPQIVQTLQEKDAQDRLNKLITFAITMLLSITIVMMFLTPLVTLVYTDGDANMTALTNAFTLWCMPQIFFYGLYTVLGQILAAKNRFGMYAWSSVGANIISSIGFIAFIVLFGRSSVHDLQWWTNDRIALTAGMWTIGVAFQAIVLFIPLARIGFTYRPSFGIQGIGLRSMGSIAGWSLAIVAINQIIYIVTTRISTSAPHVAATKLGLSDLVVAGNATAQNANTIYMLPYSLIAVSVATAIFPRVAQSINANNVAKARLDVTQTMRYVMVLMSFFVVVMVVIPLPITIALLPSVKLSEAGLMSAPLVGFSICLPFASLFLIAQRTFYAFKDGRSPFMFALIQSGIRMVLLLAAVFIFPADQWVFYIALSDSVAMFLAFPYLLYRLRERFGGRLDGKALVLTTVKTVLATAGGLLAGFASIRFVYALCGVRFDVSGQALNLTWVKAVLVCLMMTVIITVVYCAILAMLHTKEFMVAWRWMVAKTGVLRKKVMQLLAARSGDADDDSGDDGSAEHSLAEQDEDSSLENELIDDHSFDDESIVNDSLDNEVLDNNQVANNQYDRDQAEIDTTAPSVGRDDQSDSSSMNSAVIAPLSQEPASQESPSQELPRKESLAQESPAQESSSRRLAAGDTVVNRYVLTRQLAAVDGFEAWLAHDPALSRDCQMFMVNDMTRSHQVATLAAIVALANSKHFTRILQIREIHNVSLIMTQLEHGVTLREYIAAHGPLNHEAIRYIIGQTASALMPIVAHYRLPLVVNFDTIRLTQHGVEICLLPVSNCLVETEQYATSLSAEQIVARQLAQMLYGMVRGMHAENLRVADDSICTENTYQNDQVFSLDEEVPSEFRLICVRCLQLRDPDGSATIALASLNELIALLGSWQSWDDTVAQGDLQGVQEIIDERTLSIEHVSLKDLANRHIVAVDEEIITSWADVSESVDSVQELAGSGTGATQGIGLAGENADNQECDQAAASSHSQNGDHPESPTGSSQGGEFDDRSEDDGQPPERLVVKTLSVAGTAVKSMWSVGKENLDKLAVAAHTMRQNMQHAATQKRAGSASLDTNAHHDETFTDHAGRAYELEDFVNHLSLESSDGIPTSAFVVDRKTQTGAITALTQATQSQISFDDRAVTGTHATMIIQPLSQQLEQIEQHELDAKSQASEAVDPAAVTSSANQTTGFVDQAAASAEVYGSDQLAAHHDQSVAVHDHLPDEHAGISEIAAYDAQSDSAAALPPSFPPQNKQAVRPSLSRISMQSLVRRAEQVGSEHQMSRDLQSGAKHQVGADMQRVNKQHVNHSQQYGHSHNVGHSQNASPSQNLSQQWSCDLQYGFNQQASLEASVIAQNLYADTMASSMPLVLPPSFEPTDLYKRRRPSVDVYRAQSRSKQSGARSGAGRLHADQSDHAGSSVRAGVADHAGGTDYVRAAEYAERINQHTTNNSSNDADRSNNYAHMAAAYSNTSTPSKRRKKHGFDSILPDAPVLNNVKAKVAAVVVCVAVVALVLGLALSSLLKSHRASQENKIASNLVGQNLDDVPFGDTTNGEASRSSQSESDKQASTVPAPNVPHTNTVAYTISDQGFIENPNGQSGFGYYLHMDAAHDVGRFVITIRSSGGQGHLLADTLKDPTAGKTIATFAFDVSLTTEVTIDPVVQTQDLLLWVPLESLPDNQFFIESIAVY